MDRPVKLYDLHPSPNNIKVRLALGYKKIPHEIIPIDPQNREPLIRVSGQPYAPVLLHGDAVVYDSFGILRYLDANWQDRPRLFSEDRARQRKIEEWEQFVRVDCGRPVGIIFSMAVERKSDPAKIREANDLLNRAASNVERALAEGPCLMGESPNAADLTVAPMLYYGALPESTAGANPFIKFFYDSLKIEGAPKTRDWITRMMAWDPS
jgi:glutathione S-transferase